MKTLCAKAMEILMEESNVQRVDAPVTVRTKRRLAMGDSEAKGAGGTRLCGLRGREGSVASDASCCPLHWCTPIE